MVLHPSTCIIYKMQYHIWIAMCTIFVHLPKCFNAIFRFWFRFGKFVFFFSFSFSCAISICYWFHFCCSFYPFSTCNYWIAAIHLLLFLRYIRLDAVPIPSELRFHISFDLATSFSSPIASILTHLLTLMHTLWYSILRTCSRNAASLNV